MFCPDHLVPSETKKKNEVSQLTLAKGNTVAQQALVLKNYEQNCTL